MDTNTYETKTGETESGANSAEWQSLENVEMAEGTPEAESTPGEVAAENAVTEDVKAEQQPEQKAEVDHKVVAGSELVEAFSSRSSDDPNEDWSLKNAGAQLDEAIKELVGEGEDARDVSTITSDEIIARIDEKHTATAQEWQKKKTRLSDLELSLKGPKALFGKDAQEMRNLRKETQALYIKDDRLEKAIRTIQDKIDTL